MFCGQNKSRFQIDGGFIRLRFDCQLRFAAALILSVRELRSQNVRRFIGRALFNWGGFVRFDCGKRFSQLGIGFRFCLRAVGRAVV